MSGSEKYIIYALKELRAVSTLRREVIMEVTLPDAGLMPNACFGFRMLPNEAREVARLLLQKADEAEMERTRPS